MCCLPVFMISIGRIKEIINASKNISTPIVTAILEDDSDPELARRVKVRLKLLVIPRSFQTPLAITFFRFVKAFSLRHLFSYGCLSYFLWLRSKYNCMKPFLSWCLIFIIFFFVLFSWILFCFLLDQNYFKAAVFSFVIKFNN
jgi:hypothetical protein